MRFNLKTIVNSSLTATKKKFKRPRNVKRQNVSAPKRCSRYNNIIIYFVKLRYLTMKQKPFWIFFLWWKPQTEKADRNEALIWTVIISPRISSKLVLIRNAVLPILSFFVWGWNMLFIFKTKTFILFLCLIAYVCFFFNLANVSFLNISLCNKAYRITSYNYSPSL